MKFKLNKAGVVINQITSSNKKIVATILTTITLSVFSSMTQAGWEVQWIDKFEGSSVNWDNWTAQTQANYNNEVQCYTDDDSSSEKNYDVSNGTLKIIARKKVNYCQGLNNTQRSWTSGRLNSKDKQEFLYGRLEAKIRFLNLESGTWPAFWMLENRIKEQPIKGDNDSINWPNKGASEIDIWEWHADQPDQYITNFFNQENNCGGLRYYQYPNGGIDVTKWHKYAIEWTKDQINFYIVDSTDKETLVSSQNMSQCDRYEEPMFVLLNVAMGGDLGGYIDPNLQKATMEVDYVAHCISNEESDSLFCGENTYDKNIYPPIVTLNVAQNGQSSNTISPSNGIVTIAATASNLDDNSTYTYNWDISPLPSPSENGNIVTFNPESMNVGNYVVSVTIVDDQNVDLQDKQTLTLNVLENLTADTDSEPTTTVNLGIPSNASGGSMTSKILLLLGLICLFRNQNRRRKIFHN